jgi:diguanylate cyclase (GGDEF)-like protein
MTGPSPMSVSSPLPQSRGADRPAAERVRLPVLLLVAGVLLAAVAVWAPAAEQRASSERTYELTRSGQQMLTAMLDQETGLRGYLLTADRRFLDPYRRGRGDFDRAERAVLREAGGDSTISGLVARSAQIASDWQHEAAQSAERVRRRGAGTSTSAALRRKALMDRFRASNAELIEAVDDRRRKALARSEVLPVVAILLLAAAGITIGWAVVVRPRRRVAAQQRLARRYAAEQREFTEALQMTGNEDEANHLLERHLERSLPGADALVLRRNNSDNRLEVISVERSDSGLVASLEGADPRACIAIRYGRVHHQGTGSAPLVLCELCGKDPAAGESTCVPSLVGGQVIGSVLVRHPLPLAEIEDARIRDSVTQAGPMLANLRTLARAERQAATDALTGMANTRAVQDTLKRMVAQAQRTGDPLTAVMVDLDHFKQLNDVYGHERGNEALAAVGQILTGGARESDFAGRYGGEEFILLLPDTTREGGVVLAEKLRRALGGLILPDVERRVTASFGVASLPDDGIDAATLVRAADRALYQAKADGRDRVVAAQIERVMPPSTASVSPVT